MTEEYHKEKYCINTCGALCANDECECLCHNMEARHLTSDNELACLDHCISDAGTNCIFCERFSNTEFAKKIGGKMNIYIVTVKFLPKSWSHGTQLTRVITGRWIVKADSCAEALEYAAEHRGEIIEARAVKLRGKNEGIYCIEYDGKQKYGLED